MTKEALAAPRSFAARRALAYARHPLVRRPRLRLRFAAFVGPRPSDRVLDVGAGPGFNAFAFARRAAEVVVLDPLPEMLAQARREAARRRLHNLAFRQADPASLPFPDDAFALVTSAGALHHFSAPNAALAEMARVCAPGGIVALEDVIASEQDVRARYHNRLERLRDRAHRRCLSLSELVAILGQQGLLVRRVLVQDSLREFNEWIAVAATPPQRAEHIRRLLQGAVDRDLSGLQAQPADDTFLFVHKVAWVLADKPQ